MSKYRIRIGGKTYEMEIELVNEQETNSKRTQDFPSVSYKNADSVVRLINPEAERKIHFDDNTVASPMPGTIIKVLAKPGDFIEKSKPVLVLEAMKMENEICAPHNGKIKEIFVQEGQTVPGAAPLFEIETEE